MLPIPVSFLTTICIVAFLIINISDVYAGSDLPFPGEKFPDSDKTKIVPRITVEGDMTHKTTDPNGIRVNFTATATYFGSPVDVSCTPSSGSIFPIGNTTVNCKTTSSMIPLGEKSFAVSVEASKILLSLDPSAITITVGDTTTTEVNVTISGEPNTIVSISCEVEPSGDDNGISCKMIPPELTLRPDNNSQDGKVIIETERTANAQKYTIQINAEYNGGNFSSEPFSLEVTPVIPEISISISGVREPGSEITFTANLQYSSNMIKQFEWNFGEGDTKTSNTNDISHTYKNVGSYPVTVIGIDSNNNYVVGSEGKHQISITKPTVSIPEISIGISGVREPGSEITFTANLQDSSNMIKQFEWNFGVDKKIERSKIASISKTYEKASSYDISVNVIGTDADGSSKIIAHGTTSMDIKEPETPWWIAILLSIVGIVGGIFGKVYSSKKSSKMSTEKKDNNLWK